MVNPKLNQKFKEYLEANVEPGDFIYFNNYEIKMDSSRGVDAYITCLYYYKSDHYTGYVLETDLEPRDESTKHIFDLGPEDLMESEVRDIIKFLSVNHDKSREIAQKLTNNVFKKINENTILNFRGFLINEKLDFPNILNKSKEIFKKESELNRLLSELEDEDIITVIEYILSKVSDNNRLELDSDVIVFTNNLKDYCIDSFYNEYTDNPHWIIELRDPPHGMSPTNIELYALDTISLIKVLNVLLVNDKVSAILNTNVFKKINEGVESAAPETRLNIFKNFNHVNKDQMGGMEIFAPRINTEINRMSDEMYDMEANDDDDAIDNKGRDENGEPQDVMDGFDDDDTGLVINKKDRVTTPKRTLNYPYGMDNNPSPTFKMDGNTQSKSNIVFRFADYRGIGNFR